MAIKESGGKVEFLEAIGDLLLEDHPEEYENVFLEQKLIWLELVLRRLHRRVLENTTLRKQKSIIVPRGKKRKYTLESAFFKTKLLTSSAVNKKLYPTNFHGNDSRIPKRLKPHDKVIEPPLNGSYEWKPKQIEKFWEFVFKKIKKSKRKKSIKDW